MVKFLRIFFMCIVIMAVCQYGYCAPKGSQGESERASLPKDLKVDIVEQNLAIDLSEEIAGEEPLEELIDEEVAVEVVEVELEGEGSKAEVIEENVEVDPVEEDSKIEVVEEAVEVELVEEESEAEVVEEIVEAEPVEEDSKVEVVAEVVEAESIEKELEAMPDENVKIESIPQNIENLIRGDIKEKTKSSGTLDIYDNNSDTVRNLSLLEVEDETKKDEVGEYVLLTFRDINTGDIVKVNAYLNRQDDSIIVNSYQIIEVKEFVKKEAEKKEYSDEEIQEFMMAYLKKQAKILGFFNLYDEENEKLRKLEPLQFQDSVRKFGVLLISRVNCKDTETQETLEVDLTVENKEGVLEVKSMRIFAIYPAE